MFEVCQEDKEGEERMTKKKRQEIMGEEEDINAQNDMGETVAKWASIEEYASHFYTQRFIAFPQRNKG